MIFSRLRVPSCRVPSFVFFLDVFENDLNDTNCLFIVGVYDFVLFNLFNLFNRMLLRLLIQHLDGPISEVEQTTKNPFFKQHVAKVQKN